MRLRHSETPLPRDWSGFPGIRGLLLDNDLQIGSSRLRAKLLVFDKPRNLRHFWKHCLHKSDPGRECRGAVNGLISEIIRVPAKGKKQRPPTLEADSRYFCIIALVKNYLCMEVICHEAVHAAFSYSKRIKRSPWDCCTGDFHEEELCYPAGRIAAEIVHSCRKGGLIK